MRNEIDDSEFSTGPKLAPVPSIGSRDLVCGDRVVTAEQIAELVANCDELPEHARRRILCVLDACSER
jgi:hypothetical protein